MTSIYYAPGKQYCMDMDYEIAYAEDNTIHLTSRQERLNIYQEELAQNSSLSDASYYERYDVLCWIEPSSDSDGICLLYTNGHDTEYVVSRDGYIIPGSFVPGESARAGRAIGRIKDGYAYSDAYYQDYSNMIGTCDDKDSWQYDYRVAGALASLIAYINGRYWLVQPGSGDSASPSWNDSGSSYSSGSASDSDSTYQGSAAYFSAQVNAYAKEEVINYVDTCRQLEGIGIKLPCGEEIVSCRREIENTGRLSRNRNNYDYFALSEEYKASRAILEEKEKITGTLHRASVITDPALLPSVSIRKATGEGRYPSFYLADPTVFRLKRRENIFGGEKESLGERYRRQMPAMYVFSDAFGGGVYNGNLNTVEGRNASGYTVALRVDMKKEDQYSIDFTYIGNVDDQDSCSGLSQKWYFIRRNPSKPEIMEVSTLYGNSEVMIGYTTPSGVIYAVHMSREGMPQGWNVPIGYVMGDRDRSLDFVLIGAAFLILNADAIDVCSHTVRTGAVYTDPSYALKTGPRVNFAQKLVAMYNRLYPAKEASVPAECKSELVSLQEKIMALDKSNTEKLMKDRSVHEKDMRKLRKLNMEYLKALLKAMMFMSSQKSTRK